MKSLSTNQWIAIALAIMGALIGSAAQLTDLLGPQVAKYIVTIAGLAQTIVSSILVALTGQSAVVKQVAAMPGVDRVVVNAQATPALAAVATDKDQPKVGGSSAAVQATLNDIARGT